MMLSCRRRVVRPQPCRCRVRAATTSTSRYRSAVHRTAAAPLPLSRHRSTTAPPSHHHRAHRHAGAAVAAPPLRHHRAIAAQKPNQCRPTAAPTPYRRCADERLLAVLAGVLRHLAFCHVEACITESAFHRFLVLRRNLLRLETGRTGAAATATATAPKKPFMIGNDGDGPCGNGGTLRNVLQHGRAAVRGTAVPPTTDYGLRATG